MHHNLMHYALMEVMHLWREGLVLKHRQKFGKNKTDALIEVMHLWKVYLWRYDCRDGNGVR